MKSEIKVLFTRQKTQKTKIWHDGLVIIDDIKGISKVSLYKINDDGKKGEIIESYSTHLQNMNISKVNFANHLIEATDEENISIENEDNKINEIIRRPFKVPLIKKNIDKEKDKVELKNPEIIPKMISKVIPLYNVSSRKKISKIITKLIKRRQIK